MVRNISDLKQVQGNRIAEVGTTCDVCVCLYMHLCGTSLDIQLRLTQHEVLISTQIICFLNPFFPNLVWLLQCAAVC